MKDWTLAFIAAVCVTIFVVWCTAIIAMYWGQKIDPLTAFAMANAAFKGVKALVSAGREIEDVVGQLGKWYTAAANFYVGANKKKKPKLFGKSTDGMSVEEEAMHIAVARETMRKQDMQLQSLIKMRYGMDVYKQMMDLRIKLQKERLQEEEDLRKARAKFHNELWFAASGIIALVIFFSILWNMATYTGKK